MKQIILGTAGHIDHGKTSLVKAVTGIDTDRLKEEKERGITIELGFAHLELPSGRHIGVVDVPAMKTEDRMMARAMTDYWVSFAKEGSPSSGLAAQWPLFAGIDGYSMLFANEITAVEALSKDVYEFWDGIIREIREKVRI